MNDQRLVRSVLRLAHALARLERQAAARSSLSVSQGRILTYLDKETGEGDPGIRTGDLAESQGLAISTMTRNLDLLERKGWIVRHADPNDKRSIRVQLTPEGRELSRSYGDATHHQLTRAFGRLHPSEAVEQAAAVSRIAAALESLDADASKPS